MWFSQHAILATAQCLEKNIVGAQWRKFSRMEKNIRNLHFDDLLGSAKLSSKFLVLEHLLISGLEQAIAVNC